MDFDTLLRNIAQLPPDDRAIALECIQLRYGDRFACLPYRKYRTDPVGFAQDVLHDFLWSKQKEILESLVHNRRTVVSACHGPGKTRTAADAVTWWVSCHDPGTALVVTTAPTGDQVRGVLWQEITMAFQRGQLPGRLNQTEVWMKTGSLPDGSSVEQRVAFGRKPNDSNPEAFQGSHRKHVLVILDEAPGIGSLLHGALDSLLTSEHCRLLLIGNPGQDQELSEFAAACKPGSGYNVIHISAFDTPNFTGEFVPPEVAENLISKLWVAEKAAKWGTDHPIYIAKVLGLAPDSSSAKLIPASWILKAQLRTIEPEGEMELGADIGGGGNPTVIFGRRGGHARVLHTDQNPNTMETTYKIIDLILEYDARICRVDVIGLGKAVVDRAIDIVNDPDEDPLYQAAAAKIIGVNVSLPAIDDTDFLNIKAQAMFWLRQRFEFGTIDLDKDDDITSKQLLTLKTGGTVKIQADKKKKGDASPNHADALILCFADFTDPLVM